MKSPAAKSATNGFQSFVQFLVSLGVDQAAAIAVANKHENHEKLLVNLYSYVKTSAYDDLGDDISEHLDLPKALEGQQLEVTKDILANYFLVARVSISDGIMNPQVQEFRRRMMEYIDRYCSPRESVALDDFVLQCSVTLGDLISTKGTPAGVVGVFPEVLRAHILAAIPTAPALLENVLAEVESARAAAQITASRKHGRDEDPEGLHEPDDSALRCDERIADISDLYRECSTDGPDDRTVSADHEEASGQTTPPPTKMSKLEIFRLNCAPLKMPRLDCSLN